MRVFLVLVLFAALLFIPASFPKSAVGSDPRVQAQPAPGADARAAAAQSTIYRLVDVLWSYSKNPPAKWTEADIVAHGKDIKIPNPSTDKARGQVRVGLGLPDRITIGQQFVVDARVEADPDAANLSRFSFVGEVGYWRPYTDAEHTQTLIWTEYSVWTPTGPLGSAWPFRATGYPRYQNGNTEITGTSPLPDWPLITVTFSVYEDGRWGPKYLRADVVYQEVGAVDVSFAEEPRLFQNFNESQVALLPGRPVGAKAVIRSDGPAEEFEVHARFSDQPGVTLLDFYELTPANVSAGWRLMQTQSMLKFTAAGTKTIYFSRPAPPPATGALEVTLQLDPAQVLPEVKRDNNEAHTSRQVSRTSWGAAGDDKLRVTLLALGGLRPFDINPIVRSGLELFLPLSPGQGEVRFDATHHDLGAAGGRMTNQQFVDAYMTILRQATRSNPNTTRLVGYVPTDWFSAGPGPEKLQNNRGVSIPGGRLVLAANPQPWQHRADAYRELGHSLGVPYADDDSLASQAVFDGVRLPFLVAFGTRNQLGETLLVTNIMAGELAGQQLYWLQGRAWNDLMLNWGLGGSGKHGSAVAHPTDGEVVQLSGRVTAAGTGQLEPAYRMPAGVTDAATSGPYALALVDAAGHALSTFSFPISFTPEWGPAGSLESMPFSFVLPWQAGTARIALRRNGAELAALSVSPNPPAVQVLTPNGGGTLSGLQSVNWTGSDKDGSPLLYTVQYSHDGGAHWTLLAVDLDATSYAWDTSLSPGGTDGRIRVTATDGVNTGSDMSDAGFSLANHPPAATIALPAAASAFLQGYGVALSGWGFDLEDGPLADDRLTWRSDRDGVVGSGEELTVANLSPGNHVLTFSARDSQGAEASATTNVTIVTAGQPDVRLATDAITFLPDVPVAGRSAGVFIKATNVVTGTLCTFEFYNGDPAAGGTLIDSQPVRVPPDAPKSAMAEWQPATPGSYTIFARVSGCNPPESNTANNSASAAVTVAEPAAKKVYLPLVLR